MSVNSLIASDAHSTSAPSSSASPSPSFEQYFAQSPPKITVTDSFVVKALPHDKILHTVSLSHGSRSWCATIQRQQLRLLYSNLKAWQLQNTFRRGIDSVSDRVNRNFELADKVTRQMSGRNIVPATKAQGGSEDAGGASATAANASDAAPAVKVKIGKDLTSFLGVDRPSTPSAADINDPSSSSSGAESSSNNRPSLLRPKTLLNKNPSAKQSNTHLASTVAGVTADDASGVAPLGFWSKLFSSASSRPSDPKTDRQRQSRSKSRPQLLLQVDDGLSIENHGKDGGRGGEASLASLSSAGDHKTEAERIRAANRRLKYYHAQVVMPWFYRTDLASLSRQRDFVAAFLVDAFADPLHRSCPFLLQILEVGAVTFDEKMGPSFMEGWVKVRCSADASDRQLRARENRACCGRNKGVHCCCCVCFCFEKKWAFSKKRWFWAVIKSSFMAFYNDRTDNSPQEAVMFQPSTVIADQLSTTGSMNGALLVDTAWMCELKFADHLSQKHWVSTMKTAVLRCPYVERSRFTYEPNGTNSILPTEFGSHTCQGQWFVNGKEYFKHLHDALEDAKWQILISGWFLSPDTYLMRPVAEHPTSRLDMLLERACQRGVKVYVMIFQEVTTVMALGSKYCVERLQALDHRGNLFCMRHGDIKVPYFWSHHDKHVTVDQEVAFVGGIDVTYGRYDDSTHRLRDDAKNFEEQIFPGCDFNNPRVADIDKPEKPREDPPFHDRRVTPRMPWRDIHSCIKGSVALDVAWHFIQRWNFTRYANGVRRKIPALTPSGQGALALLWLDHGGRDVTLNSGGDKVVDGDHSSRSKGSKAELSNWAAQLKTEEGATAATSSTLPASDSAADTTPRAAASAAAHEFSQHYFKVPTNCDICSALLVGLFDKQGLKCEVCDLNVHEKCREFSCTRACSSSSPVRQPNPVASVSGGDRGLKLLGNSAKSKAQLFDFESPLNAKELKRVPEHLREQAHPSHVVDAKKKRRGGQSFQFPREALDEMPPAVNPDTSLIDTVIKAQFSDRVGKHKATSIFALRDMPGVDIQEIDCASFNDNSKGDGEDHRDAARDAYQTRRRLSVDSAVAGVSNSLLEEWGVKINRNNGGGAEGAAAKGTAVSPMSRGSGGLEQPMEGGSERMSSSSSTAAAAGAATASGALRNASSMTQCRCQVVRSYSTWTAGLSEPESGIQDAYKHLIAGAQHYIYIENQFFVSACGEKDAAVSNTIVNAMFARIMRARAERKRFRVYVTIPLLPGMGGTIKGDGFSGIACVMHFQFRTISQGGNSLFERLRMHGVDPEEYIFFTGLRTYQEFPHTMETEMVYIHSKMMIIDDKKAVIGSANINDRSMTGYKDSEIALIFEDTLLNADGVMDGASYSAGSFCKSLRMKCWSDNLGLTADSKEQSLINDPVSDSTWYLWKSQARSNTKIFETIFPGLVPSNLIRSLAMMSQYDSSTEDLGLEDGSIQETSRSSLATPLQIDSNSARVVKSIGSTDTRGVSLYAPSTPSESGSSSPLPTTPPPQPAHLRMTASGGDGGGGGGGGAPGTASSRHLAKDKKIGKRGSIEIVYDATLKALQGKGIEGKGPPKEGATQPGRLSTQPAGVDTLTSQFFQTNPMLVSKAVARLSGKSGGGAGEQAAATRKSGLDASLQVSGGDTETASIAATASTFRGGRGRASSISTSGSAIVSSPVAMLDGVKGYLCEYPLDFLTEDFNKLRSTVVPTEIFK